jgi:hypothetical protein
MVLAGRFGVTSPNVGGGGKAPNFWTPLVVTRQRLDRLCSNFVHLLSTRNGAGRWVWGHVTKCWGRGKAPKFWGAHWGSGERLDRFCSNFAQLISTPMEACRRVLGHVTKGWGRGQSSQILGRPLGNSRTAGPILFKLCTLTKYRNGSLQAGFSSHEQTLGDGAKAPNFGGFHWGTGERLDRFCSNFAQLISTPMEACRRVLGHVTKGWGGGKAPKFWGPALGNSRTAGPILFKLCTLTKYPNGSLQAGFGSHEQTFDF